jgi:trans-2-enoyl-CoA reductase
MLLLTCLLLAWCSPSDVNVLEGTYVHLPPALPAVAGNEGSGVVAEVGDEVSGVAVGDTVVARGWGGAWREQVVLPAANVRVLPASVDLRSAAMLSANPPTAYGLLDGVESGSWVIQNAANSGMGNAVIQVAKLKGIKTVNVVRREGLEAELRALGADAVIVYDGARGEDQAEAFAAAAAAVKLATGGAKLKLACNAVCGLSGELLAKCLAPGGTILTYGVMSREPMSVSGGQLLFKDLTYKGFHLGGWSARNAEQLPAMWWVEERKRMAGLPQVFLSYVCPDEPLTKSATLPRRRMSMCAGSF